MNRHHPKPPRPTKPPGQPGLPKLYLDFRYYPQERMWSVNAVVTPSPAVASDQDTDLQIVYSLNGAANVMLDAGAPPGTPVTFLISPGDAYNVWQIDLNVAGASAASQSVSGIAPTLLPPPPINVPTTPGTPTITFTP
jgi:hypothetical protein